MHVIESVIKTNPLGRWYIELSDTLKENSIEICLDMNEYARKIEMMGVEYGGEIEVVWSSEDNVTPVQINEIRQQITAYEAELQMKQQQAVEEGVEWAPDA